MFVGSNKVVDSIITLQFDKFLQPCPSDTIIYTNADADLLALYKQYNINTTNFTVVNDRELLAQYNQTTLPNKFNYWILQQLIKFMAIDTCKSTEVLVQDSDIILTRPYNYFNNGKPVPFVSPDTTHSAGYYEYVKKFTGRPRQTADCFVTDFMPLRNSDWCSLKQHIEDMYNQDWLTAMISVFTNDLARGDIVFSEYELLGNWLLINNPGLKTTVQREFPLHGERAKLVKSKNLLEFNYEYFNSVSIKIYDDTLKLNFDDIEYCVQLFSKGTY